MKTLSANLNVMIAAAKKAGRNLIRDFNEVERLQVSLKGPADFVSSADIHAEKILIEELQHARPEATIITEEQGVIEGETKDKIFHIDPIDGSTNFIKSIPYFSISIAYEENGEILQGVVYNPITDELFYAEKGKGAYVTGQRSDTRLRVSGQKKLSNAVLGTYPEWEKQHMISHIKRYANILKSTGGIRVLGSGALDLCYVASGKLDGCWFRGGKSWDIAAGYLIVKEAGGCVSIANKKDSNEIEFTELADACDILASNQPLHSKIQDILNS